jgi:hypothetical protein
MIDYWKIGIIAGVVIAIFGSGFWVGNSRYVRYKAEVESIAKVQEAHVQSITKQHSLVTKGIQDEYDAKLSLLRQYYSNGVRQPSSGKLSSNPLSSQPIALEPSHNVLAECAQTTLMLTELQKWFLEVYQIK